MSELHIYAARPAPPGPPPAPRPTGGRVRGRPQVFHRDGTAYWLVTAYAPPQPARALDGLLHHAERRTPAGPHPAAPAALAHELWRCDAHGHPDAAVVRADDTTLTAARGFVDLLAHRSLDVAVSTFTAVVRAVTGRPPRHVTHLTRITQQGDHLAALGAYT